jgi:hypothetical protein
MNQEKSGQIDKETFDNCLNIIKKHSLKPMDGYYFFPVKNQEDAEKIIASLYALVYFADLYGVD